MGDRDQSSQRLSLEGFRLVFNLYLADTFIGTRINKLDLPVDEKGDLPPDIIGAICLMLRSAPGTAYWDSRNAGNYRKMLEFLDPYLVAPYRPASNELPLALFIPDRGCVFF